MNADLWSTALRHHNRCDYHEAHELFEDLWLEMGNRNEKDIVQALAQADALAVHLETGNLCAAQRLMRQLPQLATALPDTWRDVELQSLREWVAEVAATIPVHGDIPDAVRRKPPSITKRGD
jgi:predicted metal-dependent hydrolase|tara:strand:- start:51 stop:416 length:366 start_codon:yes stop_codon:yes gene_type:complete